MGAKRRSRNSDSMSDSRSSACSSARSVLALRVTRNISQDSTSTPGSSMSMFWITTCSSGTKR